MKNKITVLTALLITGLGFSQIEPLLYEFPWFLDTMNVDGVIYHEPINDEIPFITLEFSEATPNFLSAICDSAEGEIISVAPFSSFSFPSGLNITSQECDDEGNETFENLYFNDIFLDNIDQPFEYGIYIIDSQIPTYGLLITAADGNWVNYFDKVVLSVPTNELSNVAIFPIPMTETLNLKFFNDITFPVKVSLIDASGRLFLAKNLDQVANSHQLDVQSVPSGLYFIKIEDQNGNQTIKKIIK